MPEQDISLFVMQKIVRPVAIALLVFAALAVAYDFVAGWRGAARAESLARDTLGVKVSVGAWDFDKKSGSFRLSDVRIAGPAGYGAADAVVVSSITGTAQADGAYAVALKSLTLSGISVRLEIRPAGTNLSHLAAQIDEKASVKFHGRPGRPPFKVHDFAMTADAIGVQPYNTEALAPFSVPRIKIEQKVQDRQGLLLSEAVAAAIRPVLAASLQQAFKAGYMKGMSPQGLEEVRNAVAGEETAQDRFNRASGALQQGFRDLFMFELE